MRGKPYLSMARLGKNEKTVYVAFKIQDGVIDELLSSKQIYYKFTIKIPISSRIRLSSVSRLTNFLCFSGDNENQILYYFG